MSASLSPVHGSQTGPVRYFHPPAWARPNPNTNPSTTTSTHTTTPITTGPDTCPDVPIPYETILYEVDASERVATITLNRPDRMNAIIWPMPYEIRHAVSRANVDDRVHCIVIQGAGGTFCSGYDLQHYAESERGTVAGSQRMPWDPYIDYADMKECTDCYMSLWRSYKPSIALVSGYAVGGGSDIALCCDMVVMSSDAKIGYPPARMWGSPTTHQWTFRIGAQQAKRMLLTGDLINGTEAERIGLVVRAVPSDQLTPTVHSLTRRMRDIPLNQLFFNKLICNMVAEGNVTMSSAQQVATMLDGMTRHTPEGVAFQQVAQQQGFQKAIASLRADRLEERKRYQQQQQQKQKKDGEVQRPLASKL